MSDGLRQRKTGGGSTAAAERAPTQSGDGAAPKPPSSLVSKLVRCWCATVALAVVFLVGSLGFVHVATPGSGIEVFDAMIKECEETGHHCPTEYRFQFRAFQQLYILDVDVARKFVPEDVHLMSLFGKTVGALFVVEYDYMNYDLEGSIGPNGEVCWEGRFAIIRGTVLGFLCM